VLLLRSGRGGRDRRALRVRSRRGRFRGESELDASDNVEVGDDADVLAEDLADQLEARPLDL
jgi:hypothetical protein